MKFGLILPHFGNFCSHERVFGHVRWMEEVGFHSVWVRDHLSFRPHDYEGQSTVFLEPFTTLAAIAAQTKTLVLGISVIAPYRHPLITSQLFGTLAYIAKGRIIAGVGAGGVRAPFDAVGLPFGKRGKIVEEMIDILRLTWRQDNVSYHGEFYNFDDMTIDPKPPADTPIYYGAMSYIGVRRAVKFCDGWLSMHTPFKILDEMVVYKRKLEEELQNKRIAVSCIPWLSIDRDSARARKRAGIEALVKRIRKQINDNWKGVSATDEEPDEVLLDGMLVVGNPEECVAQIGKFQERDYCDEIVFDHRIVLFCFISHLKNPDIVYLY